MSRTATVLDDVLAERRRQEEIGLSRPGWRSCADPDMVGGDPMRLTVLAEEFGEVARAVLERGELDSRAAETGARLDVGIEDLPLRAELVQVAAVAVAWVEAIDRRENGR